MTNDKQKEQLVELLEEADQKVQEYILENDHMDWIPKLKELSEVRADYLLTNGAVVPPCKVGDYVYVLFGNKIAKANVFSMVAETEDKKWIYILKCKVFDGIYMFKRFIYGKTVFLTPEEAEKALGGVQG